MSKVIKINGLEEIAAAARQFVEYVSSSPLQSNIFAFFGPMGAGKTTFIKALCNALEVTDDVNSPTFTIVNEYTDGKVPMYHFDLYRLSSFDDLADIGFEEYADKPAIMVIEWPDCVPELQKMYKDRITQVKITRRDEISPQRRDIEIRRFDK